MIIGFLTSIIFYGVFALILAICLKTAFSSDKDAEGQSKTVVKNNEEISTAVKNELQKNNNETNPTKMHCEYCGANIDLIGGKCKKCGAPAKK